MTTEIIVGNCLDVLPTLEEQSVHTCITSPPYWGLRDYGTAEQLGLEETPEEYVENMVQVFREVHRVLRDDGTLWLNLGDSYAGNCSRASNNGRAGYGTRREGVFAKGGEGIKTKDLVGIPWRVAFALQADGWYLRQDIIWHKPNPMPESVTDRCTKAHEYIFLLTKSKKYYYDHVAIKETSTCPQDKRRPLGSKGAWQMDGRKQGENGGGKPYEHDTTKKNKRSVWTVTTKPFKGAHFAVFPQDLIEPCILAGTSEKGCCTNCGISQERVTERITQSKSIAGEKTQLKRNQGLVTQFSGYEDGSTSPNIKTIGWKFCCSCDVVSCPCTVLDPFAGAGTTGLVAKRFGCDFVGIELNPEYAVMARTRIGQEQEKLFS